VPETSQITEPCNSHLASIGAELLKPPADFTDSPPVGAKSLPAVPAAVFMALTGFLCVSLVKDRKLWLAALAGLLRVGHAGFGALPQLAAHLVSKKQFEQQAAFNVTCLYEPEHPERLRSDIEGTQYVGLLHHLAGIPEAKSHCPHKDTHRYTSQPAIILARTDLNPLLTCLAPTAVQPFYFSPAFIFSSSSRGPPNLA
jgi:hypothetical protein